MTKSNQERQSWLFKHYMNERDFEVEHAIDTNYHDIKPHYHEFYEMYFFASGHVDYIVDDQQFHLHSGDLLIIPPNVLHNPVFHDFDVPYERYVVWISANMIHRLVRQDSDCGYFLQQDIQGRYLFRGNEASVITLRGNFMTLFRSYHERALCYRTQGISAIMYILTLYNRALAAETGQAQGGVRRSLLIDILHYVQGNLCGDLSLDKIASIFYTNKYHISHLFKQNMHISYYQYVIQMRLIAGKNNILSGIPVAKVWETCGFSDHAGFYRAFRKWYGVSPNQFKKLHMEQLTSSD